MLLDILHFQSCVDVELCMRVCEIYIFITAALLLWGAIITETQ